MQDTELNTRIHKYEMERREVSPHIPCDICMSGMDSPWYIAFTIGGTLAYVICAADAVDISFMTDTCSDCIPDPTEDRVCDKCGKEYRRKKTAVTEAEPVASQESTPETPEEAFSVVS